MFEVGKEVACIKRPQNKLINVGDVLTIRSMEKGCCVPLLLSFNIQSIDELGHNIPIGYKYECYDCGRVYISDGFQRFNSSCFVPLDDISISELTEVLEKEPFEL